MEKQAEEAPSGIKESRLRSILKAASWRVLATLTTIGIAYLITRRIDDALKIGAVEVFAKMAIYYFHERAWARLPLGTVRKMLPSQNN